MNRLLFCLALVVVVAAISVDSAPGRRLGGPKGGKAGKGSRFLKSRWNQTVDANDVRQVGIYNDTDKMLMVFTQGRNLRTAGINPSATLYNLSDSQAPLTVIRAGRHCLIIDTTAGLDYTTASTTAADRNGTTVSSNLTEVALSAVGNVLSKEAQKNKTMDYPFLKRFCRMAKMYTTSAATLPASGSEPDNQRVGTFLTLDSKVSVLVEVLGRPRGNKGGNGGKRPKGPKGPKGGRGGLRSQRRG